MGREDWDELCQAISYLPIFGAMSIQNNKKQKDFEAEPGKK